MRYTLAIAILAASASTAWLAPAHAAAVFPQGPCGGVLCGLSSSDTPATPAPPKAPQNCGGIVCDLGSRAFPTAGAPVAAAAPEPAPPPAPECGFVDRMTNSCPPPPPPPVAQEMPAPEPVTKHKKRKHVAAKRTPAPAETAAADKAN